MKKTSYAYAGVLIVGYFIASLMSNTTAATRTNVVPPKASPAVSVIQSPSPAQLIASPKVVSSPSAIASPVSKATPTPLAIYSPSPLPSPVASITQASPLPSKIPSPAASSVTTNSNPGTYTNVDGEQIQRPTYSDTVPAGASARCRDGSYSFSTHRQGTCSGHGGVAEWL